MTKNQVEVQTQIDAIKSKVQAAVRGLKPHFLGHAFLWGYVTVQTGKNKDKSKIYRVCLGSICAEDLSEAVRLAESVPGVSNVWYNLD